MKKIFLILFAIFSNNILWAKVILPSIYSNHMVIQQNSKVKIWGWSEVGEKISITPSWDTITYFTKGTSLAKWETIINTPKAGGTFTITIKGDYNTIIIEDVLLGEVWLAGGQSNMEMNMYWGLNYAEDVKNAGNNNIRFFHIPRTTAAYPQEDVHAQWVVCTPETMKGFSTAAYFFGKKINAQLQLPVGLISSCWGGTAAEVWTPEDVVLNDKILIDAAVKLKPSDGWPTKIGIAYNAMIAPIINYKIAGTIWYQGESNTSTASTYLPLFTTLIGTWRNKWSNNFPFYFVQIAPYNYGNSNDAALLREAQFKTTTIPNTGMVVTTDLVNDVNDIHPKLKKEVGERLANYALADTYGKQNSIYKSPSYTGFTIEKSKIKILFNNAENGFTVKGTTATEFYIAAADKKFVAAQIKIIGNQITVWSNAVKNPIAVRFGFGNAAMPNLFGTDGLPLIPFRTDDWDDVIIKTP